MSDAMNDIEKVIQRERERKKGGEKRLGGEN
jgi:hypothetical protein